MLRYARPLAAATVIVAGMTVQSTALAQTSQNRQPSAPQGHDMSKMDMNQMMQHCRQFQGADRSKMNADMRQMATQCDQMMKAHGGHSGTSGGQAGGQGGTTSRQPAR